MPFGIKLSSSPNSLKDLSGRSSKHRRSEHRRSPHQHHHQYLDWSSSSTSSRSSTRNCEKMKIILQDNDIIHVGQNVAGTVVVDLISDTPLTDCYIRLVGNGRVSWTENPGLKEEGRQYNVQRKVLEILFPIEDPGHHELPFEFLLPDSLSLPSSFQSRYGNITYGIESAFGEKEKRREILIDSPITHNLYLTVGGTSEKDFGVLSFASGSISMQATLDRKGFCRGEPVKVNLLIDNSSSATVKPRVSFYQTQIYMTGERHKTVENSLTEAVEGEEVLSHTIVEDSIIELPIPLNIPLSIKSELLVIKYFVHVTLDIPLATDIHVNLPIIVTTASALENY